MFVPFISFLVFHVVDEDGNKLIDYEVSDKIQQVLNQCSNLQSNFMSMIFNKLCFFSVLYSH